VPIDIFFLQKDCDRCKGSLEEGRAISFFTRETICMECSRKEDEIRQRIRERDKDSDADMIYFGCGVVPKIKQGVL